MKNTILTFAAVAFLTIFAHAEDKWTPSPLCPFPSENLTRFPYEGDCSKFWECYEGARYPMDCPEGLEYNDPQQRCDTPSIAHCNKDETITYPTFPHSALETTTSSGWSPDPLCPYPSDSLIYYPNPANCTQYYQCYNGAKYLKTCPSNLFWSVKHDWCDYLENVDCSQNNVTLTPPPPTSPGVTGTTGPWKADPLCPYPSESITYYVYPANCSQYWECFEGNKYLMNCPENLVWNEYASVCDYTGNVDCSRASTAPAPKTTTSPGTSGTGTPAGTTQGSVSICENLADGKFVPDKADCGKFYECVGGEPIAQHCPGNLYWNADKSVCDFKENVSC